MSRFQETYGPWALITGVSSGIGEQFARQLAERGLDLVLVARRVEKLRALADDLRSTASVQTRVASVDLGKEGFVHDVLVGDQATGYTYADGRPYAGDGFILDTRLRGNDNAGHTGPRYGTDLSEAQKRDLVEYLKWQDRPGRVP